MTDEGQGHTPDEFDSSCEKVVSAILNALSGQRRARVRNPEVRANLSRLAMAIHESRRICGVIALDGSLPEARERTSGLRAGTIALIDHSLLRPDESLRRLDVDSIRQLVRTVDELLIHNGDATYLFALAEEEYVRSDSQTTAAISWLKLYGTAHLAGSQGFRHGGTVCSEQEDAARRCLLALHRAQWDLYNLERGRAALKSHFLTRLAGVMALILASFAAAIGIAGADNIWSYVFLTASAGAVGASLSAVFKMRDRVRTSLELRTFAPIVVIQPVVGAIAGLFLLLVLESGIVEVKTSVEWASWGALAFLAGFSEPFFLNVVGRIAEANASGPANDKPDSKSATMGDPAPASNSALQNPTSREGSPSQCDLDSL